jgi:N-acetylmuramoyl-L-alanine amidase
VDIIEKPSIHHNERPAGRGPEIIVLHGTAGGSDIGDLSWLLNPASKVSYHYLIGRRGTIWQLVPERLRAWHAGVSTYQGRANVNDFSIGVAFANKGPGNPPDPYTPEQIEAGAWLCADIWTRRGIGLDRITTHAAVSPGRKTDPWPHFPLEVFLRRVAEIRHPAPPQADHVGRRVYSRSLGEYLIVTRYAGDDDWSFVRLSDVQRLTATRAGARLSAMPDAA